MKILFLLVFPLLVSCSNENEDMLKQTERESFSSVEWYDEPIFSECMANVDESFFKNSQWQECHELAVSHFDGKLNDAYKSNIDSIQDETSRTLFVEAQRSWIIFRDRYCLFIESLESAPTPEINRLSCVADLTSAQARRLEEAL